jgi:hypothetical protein
MLSEIFQRFRFTFAFCLSSFSLVFCPPTLFTPRYFFAKERKLFVISQRQGERLPLPQRRQRLVKLRFREEDARFPEEAAKALCRALLL